MNKDNTSVDIPLLTGSSEWPLQHEAAVCYTSTKGREKKAIKRGECSWQEEGTWSGTIVTHLI